MSITRWDPWQDLMSLRESMDEFLRESIARPRLGIEWPTRMSMPVDVKETTDEYVVKATMPGVKPEDIQIHIEGGLLRMSAETKEEEEGPQGSWLVRERRYGRIERAVTLPTNIKADQADATYESGILTIKLPKAEEARGRSIPVRAGQTAGSRPIEARARS